MKAHGLNAEQAAVAVPIIAANEGEVPDRPNAKCNRCGSSLRAKPDMLRYVKQGVVDHAGCGGTFLLWEAKR